jgi:Protein of unknown function (DUF4246)
MIPLWNLTLTPMKASPFRIHYDSTGDREDEEEDEEDEECVKVLPELGTFQPCVPVHEAPGETLKPEKTVDIRRDHSERGLQVIIKLAAIHLTPGKSKY